MQKRIRTKKYVVFLLILSITVSPMLILHQSSQILAATTINQDKQAIQQKQSQLAAAKNKQVQLEREIADLKNSSASIEAIKKKLDEKIKVMEESIELADELIAYSEKKIAEAEMSLGTKQDEYDSAYKMFLDMIKFSYEEDNANYLELIMQSENFGDFLSRVDIISNMLEYNKNILANAKNKKKDLDDNKAAWDEAKTQNMEYKAEQEKKMKDVEKEKNAAIQEIKKIENDIANARKMYDAAAKDMNSAQSDIARITKEMQAKVDAQKFVGGAFLWPVNSQFKTISSPYGNRTNPVTNRSEFHTGIDIPANYGTNIYASMSGTVIIAKYSSGYGNYVVIEHGGGVTTLYAHSSKLKVSVGTKVKKGDVIALVGSTGMSTGNHVHFEISRNGVRENPAKQFGK